ncbi:MAG TPA: hypothetical protein VFC21_09145 [Bryobacteraceae bacterium]|nr:hypothetical protein [Bryobacteraceae bacterium]
MTRRGFIGLAGAATLCAQTSQQRGRAIVDKVIEALGGDGFRHMNGRTEIGRSYTFYRDQITGLSPARIYTKYYPPEGATLRAKQRQIFGKKQEDAVILTDTAAWEITFRGPKKLPAERVQQFVDTTLHEIFYILRARIDEPGMAFESRGRDVVENQPVEIVEIYDAENRNVTVWFHQDTLLPVRQRFKRWDPIVKDQREEITRYTKYREAGNGVMWPHDTQRERDKEKIYELYSDKVTVDDNLPESMFNR